MRSFWRCLQCWPVLKMCARRLIGLWLKTGAHTGFSKDRVEIEKVDPITEIEYVDYEERFVMGVEYLGAGCVGGLLLIGSSFLVARKR